MGMHAKISFRLMMQFVANIISENKQFTWIIYGKNCRNENLNTGRMFIKPISWVCEIYIYIYEIFSFIYLHTTSNARVIVEMHIPQICWPFCIFARKYTPWSTLQFMSRYLTDFVLYHVWFIHLFVTRTL